MVWDSRRGAKHWRRQFQANCIYLRKPFLEFLPLLLLLVVVLLIGSVCFHHWYEHEELGYVRALYITYCLIFMEHLIAFPGDWVLRAFYFVLPLLGLIVILDGFMRFGYRVLRRSENAAEWVRAMVKTFSDHVILCGLGRVGLRTLEQLIKLGEDVVVLEKNPENPNIAFAERHGVPVVVGGGREEGILDDLNLREAKSIILATDDDLANLEMALDARKVNPGIRVVLRMFDQELAAKLRDAFDLHVAFSTAAQAAPLFATSSSDRSIENSFYVGDRLLIVARLTVTESSQLVGKTIGNLGGDHNLFFLSHARDSEPTLFPRADVTLQPGDTVVVQTEAQTLKLLHDWNGDEKPY